MFPDNSTDHGRVVGEKSYHADSSNELIPYTLIYLNIKMRDTLKTKTKILFFRVLFSIYLWTKMGQKFHFSYFWGFGVLGFWGFGFRV